MKRQGRFSHPLALVAQGFLAGAMLLVALDTNLAGAGTAQDDAQATATLRALTR